ncbi:MAG: hypothetical protein IKC03_05010 [Oscillospiraceae bacterium]|nr:hypothetical protein [Oscillospiraceae bacterium]
MNRHQRHTRKELRRLRETVRGCREIQTVSEAYIALLLERLGATDADCPVRLEMAEVMRALEQTTVYARTEDGTFRLYAVRHGGEVADSGGSRTEEPLLG